MVGNCIQFTHTIYCRLFETYHEIGSHRMQLRVSDFLHAQFIGRVIISCSVLNAPSHINNLEFKTVPLFAVGLQFGVGLTHQCISLLFHICKTKVKIK